MPRARKGSRKTRSAVEKDALRHREVKAAEAAAVRLLSTEDW